MPLKLNEYRIYDTWGGIRKYVLDHRDKYDVTDSKDEVIKAILRENGREIFDNKTYETFRKLLDGLVRESDGTKPNTISRENAYRILYALKIDNKRDANDLLTGYLNQQELCPRSLKEFVILSGYKINLSWEEVQDIIKEYDEDIKKMPATPLKLEYGRTIEMAHAIENTEIRSLEDIRRLIEENREYFSRTRNTQFLDFFDDLDFSRMEKGEECFEYIRKIRTQIEWEFITKDLDDKDKREDELELKSLHIFCYELDSYYGYSPVEWVAFSQEDINRLAVIFPNTFISYGNFCLYLNRKNVTDMCGGLYFFKLLRELVPEDCLEDEESDAVIRVVNYADFDETVGLLSRMLSEDGFPFINRFDPFYRLFLDTYREVLEENPNCPSSEIQAALFLRLVRYLRQILEDDKN